MFGMQTCDGEVPGTIRLDSSIADDSSLEKCMERVELKKATGSNSHIILSPQPSDDPNDPYSMPEHFS